MLIISDKIFDMTSFHDNFSETIVKAIVHKRYQIILVLIEECLFDKLCSDSE